MFKNFNITMENLISDMISILSIALLCVFCLMILYVVFSVGFKAMRDNDLKRGLKNGFLELYLNTIFKTSLKIELNQLLNKENALLGLGAYKKMQKQRLIFNKLKFKLVNNNIKFEIKTRNILTIKFLETNNKEHLTVIRQKIEATLLDYKFSDFISEKNGYVLKGIKN